jgi:hypothetical protein
MESWRSKRISWAGRIIMLKENLSTIPIYLMSYSALSSGGYFKMVSKLRILFWQGTYITKNSLISQVKSAILSN